jgi:hypothetical protein
MATLTAGEQARMYALGKIMRGGASRGGYVDGRVYISYDGNQIAYGNANDYGVLINSLTITDELDETPNTCGFRLNGAVPPIGAEVIVTLGSKSRLTRLFAGFALTLQQLYVGDRPANVQVDVRCVDYTWVFGFLTVTKQYRSWSASAIAADLVTTYAAANGFTSVAVVPNLPVLDEITFTNEPLDAALTRLARRIGGYWYVDYQKAVHLFLEDTVNAPEALTPSHKSLRAFQQSADRTQVLTRVYVEGRGSACLATVGPGATRVPLEAVDMFTAGPNVFVKVAPQGSDGGAQYLTFTGATPGGAGALVGSGTAPSSPLTLTPATGGAVTAGDHYYAYTWVSALGETVNSPAALITISGTAPAAVAPGIAVAPGPGLPVGTYRYGVTHVTAIGETAVAGDVAATCTAFTGSAQAAPNLGVLGMDGYGVFTLGAVGDSVVVRLAYRSSPALAPATISPQSLTHQIQAISSPPGNANMGKPGPIQVTIPGIAASTGVAYVDVQFQNLTQGGGWKTVYTMARAGVIFQVYITGPATSSAATESGGLFQASVTVTVQDGGADVTARRVYRTKVNGSQKYFVRQVSGSAQTTFVDTTADSALVTVPPAGTPALQTVTVKGIATGPHSGGGGGGTTARKVYRWFANVWYLLTTIADNTTTTYTDTLAEASLTPTPPPISDTSGLVADGGQVLAGATTIPVSGTGPFPATGGWVLSGNNRIAYTGVTAATLTGVPGSGDGSIQNTIPYGTPITLAPMLTGVSGITGPIVAGDELYLVVQADDPARQGTVAAMVKSGPGIREEWVQDRRLSITEARARAQATLAVRPLEDVTVTYSCRDLRTVSGKTITVSLPAPTNVWGTFKIQTVTITNFRPHPTQYPTYTVTASSRRFNFEDWLRRIETSV